MVKVDIYRSKKEGVDIIIIDTEQYLYGTVFDYITQFMNTHVSDHIKSMWFWDDSEEYIQGCLRYQGIAIKLVGYLCDRELAKKEIKEVVIDALDSLEA